MSYIDLNCTVINYIIIIIIYVLNVKLKFDQCYLVCFQFTLIVSNTSNYSLNYFGPIYYVYYNILLILSIIYHYVILLYPRSSKNVIRIHIFLEAITFQNYLPAVVQTYKHIIYY